MTIKQVCPSVRLRNAITSKVLGTLPMEVTNDNGIDGIMDVPMSVAVQSTYIKIIPSNMKARKDSRLEIIKRVSLTHRAWYLVNEEGKTGKIERSKDTRQEGYIIDFINDKFGETIEGLTFETLMNVSGTFFEQILGKNRSGIKGLDGKESKQGRDHSLNRKYNRWLSTSNQGFDLEMGLAKLPSGKRLVLKGSIDPTKCTTTDTYQWFAENAQWAIEIL